MPPQRVKVIPSKVSKENNQCDHPNCVCPKGRKHNGDGTRWELLLCSSCGSKGVHIGCDGLDWTFTEWNCEDCNLEIRTVISPLKRPHSPDNGSSSSRAPVSRNVARRGRGTWSNNRSTESRRRTCSLDNISFKVVSDNTEGIVVEYEIHRR